MIPNIEKAIAYPVYRWLNEIGFTSSVSEAKRWLKEKSIKINKNKILTEDHFLVKSFEDNGNIWMSFMTKNEILECYQ